MMETGTHSPWVSLLIAALGHPAIVANARKLRAISQSNTKSDREDVRIEERVDAGRVVLPIAWCGRPRCRKRGQMQKKGSRRDC